MQVTQFGPEQAPPSPEELVPQRLGPSPPQKVPSAQVPHSITPVQRVSVTKPQLAFSASHVDGQPSELEEPESPTTKPPEVAPLPLLPPLLVPPVPSPPVLASGWFWRTVLGEPLVAPHPEAAANKPKTTRRVEPNSVLISGTSLELSRTEKTQPATRTTLRVLHSPIRLRNERGTLSAW